MLTPTRRALLAAAAWAAALGRTPLAQAAPPDAGAEPPRLALLIGNRVYPADQDLPPSHKNVHDLKAALEGRGFAVTEGLDLGLAEARAAVDAFAERVRAAPADATALFYFVGHGAQFESENLLVGSVQNPMAPAGTLRRGSLALAGDVIARLPVRPQGLTIAVIDACRTSVASAMNSDGLNQVEAPPGCLIAFATGAGKPAIAPADDSRNTFYTGSLVKLLEGASGEITFSDLFRLVKMDVQETMLNHPVELLRRFAQFPFIAENTQVRRRVAPRGAEAASAPEPLPDDAPERRAWAALEATLWPADVERLAADYLQKWPQSPLAGSARVAREGAAEAARILRRNDVRLFRSAFKLPEPGTDAYGNPQPARPLPPEVATDLSKAGRGDKDAAARLARHWADDARRYEGWMQYAAALGNGIAAYELALFYRRSDQPLPAAQYETRAKELGYTPPPSLDNTRK